MNQQQIVMQELIVVGVLINGLRDQFLRLPDIPAEATQTWFSAIMIACEQYAEDFGMNLDVLGG